MTTVLFAGISSVTMQFAPIRTSFPMVMPPIIFAPAPMYTRSPITGAPHFLLPRIVFEPIVTCWNIVQPLPTRAPEEINIPRSPCGV